MRTVAIVNPVAGTHRASRLWLALLQALGPQGAKVPTWWTEAPGHAEILGARARREGFDRVVAAGGDGTLFEVINGLWWEPHGQLPSLGIVPLGTGCDYVRNFSVSRNPLDHLTMALGDTTLAVDAGIFRLQSLNGTPRSRVFVNVLGLGFDADIVARFQGRRSWLQGKTAYYLSGLQELARLRHYRVQGRLDDRPLMTQAVIFVVGLGRYFGGGMMITPGASPQAGRFQLVWGRRLSRLQVLGLLPKIYRGRHLNHPEVRTAFARHLHLAADPPAYVEAEGELVGRTPLEVELFPRAFRVAISR